MFRALEEYLKEAYIILSLDFQQLGTEDFAGYPVLVSAVCKYMDENLPDVKEISLAAMFGYAVSQDGRVRVANRIFETYLYNYFLSEAK